MRWGQSREAWSRLYSCAHARSSLDQHDCKWALLTIPGSRTISKKALVVVLFMPPAARANAQMAVLERRVTAPSYSHLEARRGRANQ